MTTELLKDHELLIESFTLVPSDGGRFEFSVNGKSIYSKLETGRHAIPGEIAELFRKYIEENEE